jgi:hypothetical protein
MERNPNSAAAINRRYNPAAAAHHDDKSASALKRFTRWLHLKQYQIEVTFSVYMFTPVEKFVFCADPPRRRLSVSVLSKDPSFVC